MCSKLVCYRGKEEESEELETSLFIYSGNYVYTGVVLLSSRTFLSHDFSVVCKNFLSHVVLIYKAC